jgi:hypothetical protein
LEVKKCLKNENNFLAFARKIAPKNPEGLWVTKMLVFNGRELVEWVDSASEKC